MKYENVRPARFLARPNRFVAHIDLDGQQEICHVKNTGRCRELLLPGAEIFVQEVFDPARRTRFDLIAVQKDERLVNLDSQAPNRIFREWILASGYFGADPLIRPEYRYGSSRLDFCLLTRESQTLVEVKGVTLEEEGVARFPDAPTLRGLKHIAELCRWAAEGHPAYMVFVIQMESVRYFTANQVTDPEFARALQAARRQGVKVLALDCRVEPDCIWARERVEVKL